MSKSGRDYILFLEDMLEAIGKIEHYVGDFSFDGFAANGMAVDAVIRNFEVIGEAAKNIPKRVIARYPYVEWKEAVGFRNVLIHDYFGIDVAAVWDTVQMNIPELRKHIEMVLVEERRLASGK